MVDSRRDRTWPLPRLGRWSASSPHGTIAATRPHGFDPASFQPIEHDNLVQGSLYILKIKLISIGLFEGWDDDMCCFSVLRSDTGSMRWSRARYLVYDFDAYDAFDEAGNPPVYFWARYLKMQVPANWFTLFEEARQRQRLWHMAIDRLHAGGDNERPGDDDEDDNHDHHHHPHDGTDNDPILLQYADAHTSYTQQHAHHHHPEATNVEETLSSISTLPLDAPPLHHGRITPPVGPSSRKTHFPLLSQAMHHHQSEEGPSSAHQRDTMVFSDERHGQEQPTITSETPSSIHEYATSRSIEATPRRVASTSSASLSNQQTDTQQQQHRRSLSVRSLKRLRHSLHGLF